MTEKLTVSKLLKATKSVDKFGELSVLVELVNRGFDVEWHGGRGSFDILANNKRIEVKSCNYDNDWAKKDRVFGGFDRIKPDRFDSLVCVSFDGNYDNVRYFIFTSKEAKLFPDAKWKNSQGQKNLTLVRDNEWSDKIARSSENRWDKIEK